METLTVKFSLKWPAAWKDIAYHKTQNNWHLMLNFFFNQSSEDINFRICYLVFISFAAIEFFFCSENLFQTLQIAPKTVQYT